MLPSLPLSLSPHKASSPHSLTRCLGIYPCPILGWIYRWEDEHMTLKLSLGQDMVSSCRLRLTWMLPSQHLAPQAIKSVSARFDNVHPHTCQAMYVVLHGPIAPDSPTIRKAWHAVHLRNPGPLSWSSAYSPTSTITFCCNLQRSTVPAMGAGSQA